jgi:hypothetical protein
VVKTSVSELLVDEIQGVVEVCTTLMPSWVHRGCVEKHTNLIVMSQKMNSRNVHEVDSGSSSNHIPNNSKHTDTSVLNLNVSELLELLDISIL